MSIEREIHAPDTDASEIGASAIDPSDARTIATERLDDVVVAGLGRFGGEGPVIGGDGSQQAEIKALRAALAACERRIRELEELAHADELTGLLNRRGFLLELERAILLVRRHGIGVALLYIDLDGFKRINDDHGHGAGDQALGTVAARLKGALRGSDVIGRIGGDEFGAILWQTDVAAARTTVDRLTASVESEPVVTALGSAKVGASIGLVLIEGGDSAEAALARADQAMYAAKAERRQR